MSHWWQNYPWRMIQTNLREIDMADIDAELYAQDLADFGATLVTLNAAGIIASYATKLPFHTRSASLQGDTLSQIIEACHARGIRVIARTDFSKVRAKLHEQHPDWAYRTAAGEIINYNGDVHVCPNSNYQQIHIHEILREVLSTHAFDGVFFNMSGFLVVDYSGVYHGPCHCESCRRKFREFGGTELPLRDEPNNPDYAIYAAFKASCTRELNERIIQTVKDISTEIAIHGLDYIRTESNTEIGRDPWVYSASSNSRKTAGPERLRPADNASVDFLGFRYRHTSVSPALMALRQWQNLANAGSVSLYIMGRLDNHRDVSGFAPTKRVFDFHRHHWEHFRGLESAAEVVLIHKGLMALNDPEVYGWIRTLTESHIPFDEIKLNELNDLSLLAGKRVVILGDVSDLSPDQAALFDAFAAGGGTVIATGVSGLNGSNEPLLACLGIKAVRQRQAGLMSSIFEVTAVDAPSFPRCAEAPYLALGDSLVTVSYKDSAKTFLRLIPEHPFGPPERCSFAEVSDQSGMSVYQWMAGQGIHIPWKIGSFYFNEGFQNTLNLMQDILFGFCGLKETAPGLTPMVELVLCRKEGQLMAQLINGTGCFANSFFEPVPVRDIQLTLPGLTGKSQLKALNGGKVELCKVDAGFAIRLDVLHDYEAIIISG